MRWVHNGPIVGVLSLVVLLALVARALVRHDVQRFGPANWVTLTRALLVCWVTALVASSFGHPAPVPLLVAVASVALVLDAVDGRVARRTNTASVLGARFDMEVDAFLILVLSAYVAHAAGSWVLAMGLARYVFVGSRLLLPWLRGTVPPRPWCKAVAAIQGVVLTVVAADVLPHFLEYAALLVALVLLMESFGREVWWLWLTRATSRSERATRVLAS